MTPIEVHPSGALRPEPWHDRRVLLAIGLFASCAARGAPPQAAGQPDGERVHSVQHARQEGTPDANGWTLAVSRGGFRCELPGRYDDDEIITPTAGGDAMHIHHVSARHDGLQYSAVCTRRPGKQLPELGDVPADARTRPIAREGFSGVEVETEDGSHYQLLVRPGVWCMIGVESEQDRRPDPASARRMIDSFRWSAAE